MPKVVSMASPSRQYDPENIVEYLESKGITIYGKSDDLFTAEELGHVPCAYGTNVMRLIPEAAFRRGHLVRYEVLEHVFKDQPRVSAEFPLVMTRCSHV